VDVLLNALDSLDVIAAEVQLLQGLKFLKRDDALDLFVG
jgi:hypothetical protein